MKKLLCATLAAALILLSACSSAPTSVPPAPSSQSELTISSEPAESDPVSSEPVSSEPDASEPASSEAETSSELTVLINSEGAVQESERAADSFFDDAVFVGDSVSLKLKLYVTKQRSTTPSLLGKAQFLTNGSIGSGNLLQKVANDSTHPTYNGERMAVEDSIALMGAKKVYIMVGMNDIAVYGTEGSVENFTKLIGRILEKSPDAKIYVQSGTPILAAKQINALTNANMEKYNAALLAKCLEQGWPFIDIASIMRGADGSLIPEYCSDPGPGPEGNGVHFTDLACELWIDYLYTHTGA